MPNHDAIPLADTTTEDAAAGFAPLSRSSRSIGFAVALLIAAAALGMTNLWAVLHSQWIGVALYEHGYLVAGMSAWLCWQSFRAKAPATLAPDWRWTPLFVGVLAMLILFDLLFLNVPRVFLIPPLVIATAGLVFGRAVAARVFWPVVLLYSAMPVWAPLTRVLQSMTTAVVSGALAATGIPAFIEGNFVHLPAGAFEIAEDCSGLRYLVIATTLLLFYALAFLSAWRQRIALLTVGIAGAIVCNWLRVYTIIVVGHLTNMQHHLVHDHVTFGWILFAAFLVPVLLFARWLEGGLPGPPDRSPAPVFADGRGVVTAAFVAAGLLMLPKVAAVAESRVGVRLAAAAVAPAALPAARDFAWRPVFANANEEHELIDAPDGPIEAYRARYPRQDAEHRLIAYGNTFVPNDWQAIQRRYVTVTVDGETFDVLELEGYLNSARRVVWAWYSVAGGIAVGPLEAKWLELEGLLSARRDAAALAVAAKCDVDCEGARRRLQAFLNRSTNFFSRSVDPSAPVRRRGAGT